MQNTMLQESKSIQLAINECHKRGIGFCGLSEPWKGSRTKLLMLCGKHGAWRTTSYKDLMRGIGCRQCGMEKLFKAVGDTKRQPEEYWVSIFKETGKFHGGHSFKRMHDVSRWIVNCEKCANDEYGIAGLCDGEFEASRDSLRRGNVPCRCSGFLGKDRMNFRISRFCAEAGYGFVKWRDGSYENPKSYMVVNCSAHGNFEIRADSFIYSGTRCSGCARGGFSTVNRGVIYALRSDCGDYIKIGISNKPKNRMRDLSRCTPFVFSIERMIRMNGGDASRIETEIHRKYESAGFSGFQGCTEWLKYDPSIIEDIKNRA